MTKRTSAIKPGRSRRDLATRIGIVAAAVAATSGVAHAQSASTQLPPISVNVTPGEMCPLDGSTADADTLASQRPITSDAASLLAMQPGVSLQTGGGVSSLPVLHGLADDRVRVLVDGMSITASCPNHMNPALSFIDPTNVAQAQVLPGIAPVSLGGDSIGGTISVQAAAPHFAKEANAIDWNGSLSTFYRSNGNGLAASGRVSASTDQISLEYTGAWARAGDYSDGQGHKVLSTLYETENHEATLGIQGDDSLFVLRVGLQDMPYQGFPNQRMDIVGNRGTFVNASYARAFDWGKLDGRVYWQDIRHEMNMLGDKGGAMPGMPMDTHSNDIGYRVQAEIPLSDRHTLRVGSDFDHYTLNDWWPAIPGSMMMGPNTFENINNGERTRLGVFSELDSRWSSSWTTQVGARIDGVSMNTGQVQPYNSSAMIGMGMMAMANPNAGAAAAFNRSNRARADVNVDLTALARYSATEMLDGEIGVARMTRSPNLYERYAWAASQMAQSMIGWFGDGNLYTGNLNLRPEVANTLSIAAVEHASDNKAWAFKISPYFTYVQDFIGANQMGIMTQRGSTFAMLQFANRDARLYGVDASGHVGLWDNASAGRGRIEGVIGWVQGQYVDTGNSLYHMMPFNARLSLVEQLGGWTGAADLKLVAPKTLVDSSRIEPTTPGYAVLNLRASYELTNVRFDAAVENVLDQKYYDPLGGVDYGDWQAGSQAGQIGPLPAMGRSFIVGVTFKL